MAFDPILAEVRFGLGLSPDIAPPASAKAMLSRLTGPDPMFTAWPTMSLAGLLANELAYRDVYRARSAARKAGDAIAESRAADDIRVVRQSATQDQIRAMAHHFARARFTHDAFRERLTSFWADHFTTSAQTRTLRYSNSALAGDAVRPHVAGRFDAMLRAVVGHPLMLDYLDQLGSIGPNSPAGQGQGRRGLNENLARELLELHTLGVGGPYGQTDVRQLAELLTGLTFNFKQGLHFNARRAEPGSETVLGIQYGGMRTGPQAAEGAIWAVLNDLARHPATARHLAGKLATHFVSDTPPGDLVDAMATAYLQSDTDLLPVYEVLLDHPAAWNQTRSNVKWPADFVASAIRALALPEETFQGAKAQEVRQVLANPLAAMGQPWEQPGGPDGWSEDDGRWITPQGIAARIDWALRAPSRLMADLPDPRLFVRTALGPDAPAAVVFAAEAAETRAEGIGIILASPAFQRR